MKTRIISALVALPLLIFIVVSGGLWMHLGIAVLGLVGMYEFNKAISKEVKGTHIIAYLFGLIYLIFIDKIIYTAPLFSVLHPCSPLHFWFTVCFAIKKQIMLKL